jgi:hypothetical protein
MNKISGKPLRRANTVEYLLALTSIVIRRPFFVLK